MAAALINNSYTHQGHYSSYTQAPPSPPMEDIKCSLPSISNLLGLADAGSPTSETSPTSQRPSPQPEAHHIKNESRPGSGYGKTSYRGLPPSPPMSSDASFDGYHSPSARSTSHFSNASVPTGHYYETTPPLESDMHRQSIGSMPVPRTAVPVAAYTQPQVAAFPAPYLSQAYYPSPPPQAQISGLYYQRGLPRSFPPPLVMPASAGNPWQHHHYLNPTGGPNFPQSQDRYICPTCNKAFSRPSSLRIHSHSHTGEKPFKCPHTGCGKAFSVRSNMKRHERGCHSFEVSAGGSALSS